MSCSTSQSGARYTGRSTPESDTAWSDGANSPGAGRVAVNQISVPDGAHANPKPAQSRATVDLRPDLSTTVIIACAALPNITGPSKNATRLPSGDTRSDHAARASWTVVPAGNSTVQGRLPPASRITASASVPGIQSASTTPASMSRRDPPAIGMRASMRTPQVCSDVLRTEQDRHVASSGNRHDSRVLQLQIARIRVSRSTEECGVGLTFPAGAIDEAQTIWCEAGGRYGPLAERRWQIFRDAGSGPHRRRNRCKHSRGQRSARDAAPETRHGAAGGR